MESTMLNFVDHLMHQTGLEIYGDKETFIQELNNLLKHKLDFDGLVDADDVVKDENDHWCWCITPHVWVSLVRETDEKYLAFANACSGYRTLASAHQLAGAIVASEEMPTLDQFLEDYALCKNSPHPSLLGSVTSLNGDIFIMPHGKYVEVMDKGFKTVCELDYMEIDRLISTITSNRAYVSPHDQVYISPADDLLSCKFGDIYCEFDREVLHSFFSSWFDLYHKLDRRNRYSNRIP